MLLMHGHWPYGQAHYYLGRLEGEQFYPEEHGRMTWPGGSFAGPETMLDGQGRRILFGWIPEGRYPGGRNWTRFGWSSCISLPRLLSLGPDRTLRIQPVPELEALRLNHRRLERLPLAEGQETSLPGIAGDSLELDVRIAPGRARFVGLEVRCAPDDAEASRIALDSQEGALAVMSVTRSGQDECSTNRQEAPFTLPAGDTLRLRVFLDRSVIEVFANDRLCLTQRIYPSRSDSTLVKGFVQGDGARIESLEAWDMMPVV
jgi:beta-fructofuranosidase